MAARPETRAAGRRVPIGHFDAEPREYVITEPLTPLPWINYLGGKALHAIVSNTGGGYSFYRDAKLRRLTRYRYDSVPLDSVGKYLYIVDGDVDLEPGLPPDADAARPLRVPPRPRLHALPLRTQRPRRGPARVRRRRGRRRVPGPHAARTNQRRGEDRAASSRTSSGACGTRRTTPRICSATSRWRNAS